MAPINLFFLIDYLLVSSAGVEGLAHLCVQISTRFGLRRSCLIWSDLIVCSHMREREREREREKKKGKERARERERKRERERERER